MKLDHIKNWKTSLTTLHETTLTSTASDDQRPPTRLVLPVGEAATIYFCVALGLNGTNENLSQCRGGVNPGPAIPLLYPHPSMNESTKQSLTILFHTSPHRFDRSKKERKGRSVEYLIP